MNTSAFTALWSFRRQGQARSPGALEPQPPETLGPAQDLLLQWRVATSVGGVVSSSSRAETPAPGFVPDLLPAAATTPAVELPSGASDRWPRLPAVQRVQVVQAGGLAAPTWRGETVSAAVRSQPAEAVRPGHAGTTAPLSGGFFCLELGGAWRDRIDRSGRLSLAPGQVPAASLRRPAPVLPGASGIAAALSAAGTPVAPTLAIANADVFNLETNPGSSKTIYLNFLGANLAGTAWVPSGSTWNGVAPAFSLDSDTSTNFSAAELAAIKEIFARVACDYAPFNVNVTTKAPGSDKINRSSSSDAIYGTVCLISNISSQVGFPSSGGVAYVGIFDGINLDAYKPALVFPDMLGNSAKNIAEAASHEIGHNLNLSHDGTSSSDYYAGQGSSPGWAPIMGVGYSKTLTQFSRGTYAGASNTENDFAQIAGEGVDYWQDYVGNDRSSAQALTLTDANGDGIGDKLQLGGTIELTSSNGLATPDLDCYSFLAPSNGSVTINVRNALYYFDPAASRYTFAPVPSGYGNLRLDARLEDAAGSVLADWSGNASLDVSNFTASGLIGGQSYTLSVFANAASPDGEDTYGSLGDYVFDLVYQGQPLPPSSPQVRISAIGGADSVVSAQSGDASVLGTAEANRSVTITSNGTTLGVTTADATGAFSYALTAANLSTLGQGSGKAISASQTDAAGNTGTSAPFPFTIQTAGPVYSLTAPASVQEGQSLALRISATNVVDGTVLNWRFSGSGVTATDFAPATLSGGVTVSAGSASVATLVAADNSIEPTETALFELLDGAGLVVASSSIALQDTNVRWGTTASDTITGTDNRFERISGVLATGTTASALGSGQRDVITGGVGPDEFLLSEVRSGSLRVFYNDNVNNTNGTADYLQINDFNPADDVLRFGGGRYFSRLNGSDTWIWFDRNNNGALNTANQQGSADELVAVLKGVNLGAFTLVKGTSPAWAVFS